MVIFGGIVERYQNRLRQREAEGEARGEARGEVQGAARERKKWEDWNQRRMEAKANGELFDEPPPSALHQEKADG